MHAIQFRAVASMRETEALASVIFFVRGKFDFFEGEIKTLAANKFKNS